MAVVATLAATLMCWGHPQAQTTAKTPVKIDVTKPDTTPIRPQIPGTNRYLPDKIFLERANSMSKMRGDDFQIVVGDVMFRRGDMYMYCDSANFYDVGPGALRAFGNVHMEQGDTLFVYADELEYADSTQLAVLYADAGKKVRLINRDVTLLTDIFNYDLGIELGFYEVGGQLIDKKNDLRSLYGEYSPSTKDALFKEGVHLHSLGEKDTLDIYTDELLYNTESHIATLDTSSTIISTNGTIHTTQGSYNTETTQADLYDRSLVIAKNGNTLTGDTLFFDRNNGIGRAWGNIKMVDTTHRVILTGDFGFFFQDNDSARVYGKALAKQYSNTAQSDTLYLHGDTITTRKVIIQPRMLADSTWTQPDTTHHVIAAPHVRFYRTDLQGLCDSLTFVEADSLLYLDYHPVVWNDTKQIFGNEIKVHLRDSTADWAHLPNFGFMAEEIEGEYFNQITGKEMRATFDKGQIKHLDVSGNVEVIMLPMENDSTYNKIANVESSFLAADFKDQNIDHLKLWPETSGTMTPLYLAKRSLLKLSQFRWFDKLRPTGPEDVFNISADMLNLMAEPPFGNRKTGSTPPHAKKMMP